MTVYFNPTDGPPTFPVRCAITSHQYNAEGWCYGVGINEKGRPFALVVFSNGVRTYYLDDVYDIEFK